jgi:hypothetical protein
LECSPGEWESLYSIKVGGIAPNISELSEELGVEDGLLAYIQPESIAWCIDRQLEIRRIW